MPQRSILLVAALGIAGTAASALWVHPQELAYFNVLAGGPARGHEHLLESNIDWGQDLIRLRRWLQAHPEAHPLFMAFHSQADPAVYGIDYLPAPLGPCEGTRNEDPDKLGPKPGWYVVSTNLVMGLAHPIPDGRGGQIAVPPGAFACFQEFKPVARPGYGLFVYEISPEQANRVRRVIRLGGH